MQGYTDLPPEFAAEQQGLVRRQRIAEAMIQRGMTPIQSGNPRSAVSWTQGLAQMLNAYQGGKAADEVDKGHAALGQRYQQGLADEVKRVAALRAGTPATSENIVDEQAAGGEGAPATINAPAVPADPRAAVMAAMMSHYAPVREMGKLDYSHMKKGDEPFTLGADQVRYGPNGDVLAVGVQKPEKPAPSFKAGDTRKLVDGETEIVQEYQADGTWKEIGRGPRFARQVAPTVSNVQPAPVTAVTIQDPNDPNGTIVVDGRTGKRIGKGPKLSETGKANQKRQIASQGVGDAIAQARDLLTGKGGQELPTQSGIGAGVDYAASIFGITPKGAKSADRLKVVGGSLVQKVPRFEGPQSDKDVSYYKEVAGRIGDPTVPIDRRLAALEEVENIWGQFESGKKYGFFQTTGPGGAVPAQGSGGLTPAEQAELDALRKKHGRPAR